jgi:micrococcal nuclease
VIRTLLLLCLWVTTTAAAPRLPGPIPAQLVRILDGDTFEARVDIWLDIQLTVLVRLRGINAPETACQCEQECQQASLATAALERLAEDASGARLPTGPLYPNLAAAPFRDDHD